MASGKSTTAVKRRCCTKKDAATDLAALDEVKSDDASDDPAAKSQRTESPKGGESKHSSPVAEPVVSHATCVWKTPAVKKTSTKPITVEKEKSQHAFLFESIAYLPPVRTDSPELVRLIPSATSEGSQ